MKCHSYTKSTCMICDEPIDSDCFTFHKTRRQTHRTCIDCGTGYLQPITKTIANNLRKNIKSDIVKCPGTYHSDPRNQCTYQTSLSNIVIKGSSPLDLDIFRITYAMKADDVYICPEKKCGQILVLDLEYNGKHFMCTDCKTSWCRYCLVIPFHTGKSCLEYEVENKNTENGRLITELKEKGELKYCPQCRVATTKNNGCNKMLCTECDIKWCWLCTHFPVDYSHFRSTLTGGCAGKLWEGVHIDDLII